MGKNDPVELVGYTRKALQFIFHKSCTVDEVALHLGISLGHARDVLFRARRRGLLRKVPVEFRLTDAGKCSVVASWPSDKEPEK